MNIMNAVRLLDEQITTVKVCFDRELVGQLYTYLCDKKLAATLSKGDTIAITKDNAYGVSLGFVYTVDEESDIDVNGVEIKSAAICKVDFSTVDTMNTRHNEQRQAMLGAQRANMRKQLREQLEKTGTVVIEDKCGDLG